MITLQFFCIVLGNISKDFSINIMKKKTGLLILILYDTNDTFDIHKHFMRGT